MYTKYHKVFLFFLNEEFLVTFSLFSDIITRHSYQELSDEQEELVRGILTAQIQMYTKYRTVATADEVLRLVEHIKKTYELALMSVGVG